MPVTGRSWQVPLEFRVRAGTLDPVDIPAGPFGYAIGIPWYHDDPRAAEYNRQMVEQSLRRDARIRLHGLHRLAVDFVPRVQPRANRSSTSPRPIGR